MRLIRPCIAMGAVVVAVLSSPLWAASGYESAAMTRSALDELVREESRLLSRLERYADESDQLALLTSRYKEQSSRLKRVADATLNERAACERMQVEMMSIVADSSSSEAARAAMERDVESRVDACLERIEVADEYFVNAQQLVASLSNEVEQMRMRGELNASEASALNASLERVRANISFVEGAIES